MLGKVLECSRMFRETSKSFMVVVVVGGIFAIIVPTQAQTS